MVPHLKKLRERLSISQEYMAKELDVSRPTYMQIEKGEKEPTVSQMRKLITLFGPNFSITDSMNASKKTEVYLPEPNLKKFKETLLYILEKVGAKPNIGETALYKLLYFIDFDFFEKYGRPLTGATYMKNYHGPTPKQFKPASDEMIKKGELERVKSKYFQYDQKKYFPLRKPQFDVFTVDEIKHIDEVLTRLSEKNASELSVYSHEDIPWLATEDQNDIDYRLVFQRAQPYAQVNSDALWMNASAEDILKHLPPLTKEEYDYYMSLPDKQ